MTTNQNAWERLREAAETALRYGDGDNKELAAALAALPASPPEPDVEREKAIEAWRAGTLMCNAGMHVGTGPRYYVVSDKQIDEAVYVVSDKQIDEAVALMRSAPAAPAIDNEAKHMAREAEWNTVPATASDWRPRLRDELARCSSPELDAMMEICDRVFDHESRLAELEAEVARRAAATPTPAVTDDEIEAAIGALRTADRREEWSDSRAAMASLRTLIARRVQQAKDAVQKRYDHVDRMLSFQSQVIAGVLAGKRIEGSDLLTQRQGNFTEGDVQLLELVRRVTASEELARAVDYALDDDCDVDRAESLLRAALAAFRAGGAR